MSQENMELACVVLDALGMRDTERLIELTHPEIEWRSFFAVSVRGVYRGHDGTRQYMADLNDAFEIVRPEVDDTLAVGDVVVLVGRLHYRGQGSGVESESPAGWMFKCRDGKILTFNAFRDPAQSLEAVGLEE